MPNIADVLALGPVGSTVNFNLLYKDKDASMRSVFGLAPTLAKNLRIGHERSNSGKQLGDIVELQFGSVNPADSVPRVDRLTLVAKRGDYVTLVDFKFQVACLVAFLSNADNVEAIYSGGL